MRIYLMTDLEGVAGVLNFEDWCAPDSRYYEMAKRFLTEEVNAAVDGFFAGGASHVVVADGHGHGGINPELLDHRAQLMRGWTGFPLNLDGSYDAVAWVGQHAKASTEYAHLAHTQNFSYIDLSVNGISIGELGQFAMCASELGVPSIFASGDEALTKEATALIPGIETVSVKRGIVQGTAGELSTPSYMRRNYPAVHLSPKRARELIRSGAQRAIQRAVNGDFGIIDTKPPYERVAIFRPKADGEVKTISRESHLGSVASLFNLPFNPKPLD
jgi:D-amino peptidase